MNGLILGSIGVYALLVGFNGSSSEFVSEIVSDSKGFFPWAISAAVLAFAYEYKLTKPIVGPFLFLAILGFVLRNFETLKTQIQTLYSASKGN